MSETLNLREMLCGDADRLRFISRFSTCNVLHKESVAEHCFYVAFYALQIGHWVVDEAEGEDLIDFTTLMGRALVHDIDESRTGDFYRPFKYSNPLLRDQLEKAADREVRGIFDRLWDTYHPKNLTEAHWRAAKNPDREGCIVAFADFLAVLSYMWTEIQVANHTMREHRESMLEYISTFRASQFKFLEPLMAEAERILEEVLG
jgi:5'-deoxynucleotidase YfbR-like HD superfamily hydrolase